MNMTGKELHLPYVKMSAAGNDFVLLDELQIHPPVDRYDSLAVLLCNRNFGVGADGLLVYRESGSAAFEMDYYNADGSTGGMCGNGARCIAAYHFDMYGTAQTDVRFQAFGYTYEASKNSGVIAVRMKDPSHILQDLTINVDGTEIVCHFIDTGSPHVVVFMDDLRQAVGETPFDTFDISVLGRRIRNHEAFKPLGANVNFIVPRQDTDISLRTYERGVENETLACGTGAVASAVIHALRNGSHGPFKLHTRSGEILTVDFSRDEKTGGVSKVTLAGSWLYHHFGMVLVAADGTIAGTNRLPTYAVKIMQSRISG
jgi:diaminopimelate epimerase